MRPFRTSLLSLVATRRFRQRHLKPPPFGGSSSARIIPSGAPDLRPGATDVAASLQLRARSARLNALAYGLLDELSQPRLPLLSYGLYLSLPSRPSPRHTATSTLRRGSQWRKAWRRILQLAGDRLPRGPHGARQNSTNPCRGPSIIE